MNLKQIVHFIYEHSLSMYEPLSDEILDSITLAVLDGDGFRIFSTKCYHIWVRLFKCGGNICVQVSGVGGAPFRAKAQNQLYAEEILSKMVAELRAA